MDPNAPQEPLDADAQAEVDGGEGGGEVPLDEEDDDGSVAGSLPSGSPPKGSPPPSQASQPGRGRQRWQPGSGVTLAGSPPASEI